MANWLFKEEPTHYSFADLERDGSAWWEGVTNSLARKHLRKVKKGDHIFFYHTGKEKAVVGEMQALADARSDAGDEDPKAVAVEVKAVRRLPKPVPLARIKKDRSLADWELVRLSRLSVMPVSTQQWQRVQELSREKD
jgi:predicted RNA-binding protein with PUA-like domain